MELCMDNKLKEKLQEISSGSKAAFTRDYNKTHEKDGFSKIGAGKSKAIQKNKGSDSEEFDSMLDEDEVAEQRLGREKQKELD